MSLYSVPTTEIEKRKNKIKLPFKLTYKYFDNSLTTVHYKFISLFKMIVRSSFNTNIGSLVLATSPSTMYLLTVVYIPTIL